MVPPNPQQKIPTFPFNTDQINPPAEYAERRTECPLGRVQLASGHEAALLVTYPDVAAALNDARLSHNLTAPGSPRITFGPSVFDDPNSLPNKEGADHLRIRRIVGPAFSPRRLQQWKPEIERLANEFLDEIEAAGPWADMVKDYCVPVPTRVIATVLGIPEKDSAQFYTWSNAITSAAKMTFTEQIRQFGRFAQYTAVLIATRRANPRDGLLDDLIAARDGNDRLSERELIHLVIGLIAAGTETTSNSLARYLLTLLTEAQDVWEKLVADPALAPTAVEELMRHTSLGTFTMLRRASEDVELPSGTIKSGETVALAVVAAHRDDSVYPRADTVRLDRPKVPILAFGGGPHRCLGAYLAQTELQISLAAIARRLPTLRLTTPPDQLSFTDGELMSSLVSLPVAW